MTPATFLSHGLLLPELELKHFSSRGRKTWVLEVHKQRRDEVCPRCATLCHATYDRRKVRVRDDLVRNKHVELLIHKRRIWCPSCRKPFTEPVPGVFPGRRTSERYRRALCWAAENFQSLKHVQRAYRCSSNLLYTAVYEQLHLRRKQREYPWPRTVGIDEHSFRKNKRWGYSEFVTMLVDHPNGKLFEVVEGKTGRDLLGALSHIEGRENVSFVTMDMSSTYRSFVKSFFPRAEIVADKFHVLRLLGPAINRRRKAISGDRRKNPIGTLLLRNYHDLALHERSSVERYLHLHAELQLIYGYKERLHRLYRTRGYNKAKRALIQIMDELALSSIPELQRLRKTLKSWQKEILRYFQTGLTNGRTEGFNRKAKLVKRMACGYKSFRNYRVRLLNACSH
jgi:transposase